MLVFPVHIQAVSWESLVQNILLIALIAQGAKGWEVSTGQEKELPVHFYNTAGYVSNDTQNKEPLKVLKMDIFFPLTRNRVNLETCKTGWCRVYVLLCSSGWGKVWCTALLVSWGRLYFSFSCLNPYRGLSTEQSLKDYFTSPTEDFSRYIAIKSLRSTDFLWV